MGHAANSYVNWPVLTVVCQTQLAFAVTWVSVLIKTLSWLLWVICQYALSNAWLSLLLPVFMVVFYSIRTNPAYT